METFIKHGKSVLKRTIVCLTFFVALACIILCTGSNTLAAETAKRIISTSIEPVTDEVITALQYAKAEGSAYELLSEEQGFSMEMLDVGQGLSVLFEADGHYLLYDGGGRDSSSYVVAVLKGKGIESFDYIVSSHYDEDHLSGLIGVLNVFDVDTCLCADYESDTKIYTSFVNTLNNSGAEIVHPCRGDRYTLGRAEITIISPGSYSYSDYNNDSIAMMVNYGKFSCIVTGDAEAEAEEDMIKSGLLQDTDVYIAGHHGSSSSSSAAFVSKITPEYVFISVGANNSYGHPTENTLNTLKNDGCEIFRTDKQGEVTVWSDGVKYWFSEDPCDDWTPGIVETEEQETPNASAGTTTESTGFILNASSKKIHLPTCSAVDNMLESNKRYSNASIEDLEAHGYSPCKLCHPEE